MMNGAQVANGGPCRDTGPLPGKRVKGRQIARFARPRGSYPVRVNWPVTGKGLPSQPGMILKTSSDRAAAESLSRVEFRTIWNGMWILEMKAWRWIDVSGGL